MESFFVKVIKMKLWKKMLSVFCLGGISVFSFPPFHIVGVLWIIFPLVLLLLDSVQNKKQSFFLGYTFGAGMFISSMYWIYNPLTTMDYQFAWLIPFAYIGLALWGGLFSAVTFLITKLFKKPFMKIVVFALVWTVCEIIRSNFPFGGIAWNTMATVWTDKVQVAQIVAIIGAYGLTLITIFMVSLPFIMTREAAGVSVAILLLLYVFGQFRIAAHPIEYKEGVNIRIVQSNISQDMKYSPQYMREILQKQLSLSLENSDNISHVIWTETSWPYYWDNGNNDSMFQHATDIFPENTVFITGVLKKDGNSVFNSVVAVKNTEILNSYDKFHLVPFGEYVPLRKIIPIEKIVQVPGDFSAGIGPRTIDISGLGNTSVLICYEIIFSGNVVDRVNHPDLILNITNDKWFGDTAAPHQHYANAVLRAIEEGVPVIRAANSGISGAIAPTGITIAKLGVNNIGYLDIKMPRKIQDKTIFSNYGYSILYTIMLIISIVASITFYKQRQ